MPIISNSIQNNGGSSQGIRSQTRTYRSGNSTLHLREGQTLRGVISDIHGNDITLSMEDGSSFTGQLPDANQYSIGQKAAFLITGLENNTIYMKATTGAYLLNMEDTIAQALEEALLPRSPRNLDVVRSLLSNSQSISRENIMASIQLCAQYPEADVHSVITMKCLGTSPFSSLRTIRTRHTSYYIKWMRSPIRLVICFTQSAVRFLHWQKKLLPLS